MAGNGLSGFPTGDGSPAVNARVGFPLGVAVDANGNLFINSGDLIRRVDAVTGIITTVAGGGSPADGLGDGGPATSAELKSPCGVAVDSAGNIFIAEDERDTIRRVDAVTGIITTVAGNGTFGFGGDGGLATSASFRFPVAATVDSAGNLFIADQSNHRIRRVDAVTGIITTVAGNGVGTFAGDGGPATSASLAFPAGVALDSAGNIFIPDSNNNLIRRVDAVTGIITTVAGDFTLPFGFSGDGGPATSASFDFLTGAALDGLGNLFITDTDNNRIRRMFLGGVDADDLVCEEKTKPLTLTMRYTGDDCSASSHSQDPKKVPCKDLGALPAIAQIVVRDKPGGSKLYFNGLVPLDGTFTIDPANAGDDKLKSNVFAEISDASGIHQTVGFHTSCSQPLSLGDQFGSLRLVGVTTP